MRNKRPYNSKHPKDMIDLAVEALKNKTVSSYEAEKIFGIPRRTLLDKLYNKHPKSPGCPTRLTEEEETNITKVLIAAADYGSPLTLLDLRIVVYRYLEANKKLAIFSNKLPGKKWAYSFVKRNKSKLSYRVTQNIKRSRAEKTPSEMNEYFRNLEVSLEGVPSENILNYDETNFTDNPGAQKCLFRRGVKYPERVLNFTKGAISIMFAITAGGESLPPYVVYKAENLYSQWTINGPRGSRYNRSKSGWFDSFLFEDWFETIILPWAKNKSGTKILIGDNLASHINHKIVSICEENNIRFVFLPPNSTHLTQPLDVCYFGPLKKLWREILLNYKIKNPREATIHKGHFPDLLKKIMEKLNEKTNNIISAFRSTGIVPFNPDRVISKLPGSSQSTMPYTIDNALLDWLKETRSPNPDKKVRNKKLNVLPGKSVSTDDFKQMTTQLNKEKRKVKKKQNENTNPQVNSDYLLQLPLIVKTPDSLSKLCTTVLNAYLEQSGQKATNVHRLSEILKYDEANMPFIDKEPECLQISKPKIIINSNVIIKASTSKKYEQIKQERTKIDMRGVNIISRSALRMKLGSRKKETVVQEKATQMKYKVIDSVERKPKNESKKRKLKITKTTLKQRKKRFSSESSSISTNEICTADTDNSECETMEDYIAEYLQEDIENIEPSVPYGVSDIQFTEHNDISQNITKNSWILVKFATKKSVKHFVGKVISIRDKIPEVKFVRKKKEPKFNRGSVFTYPTVEDICTIKHLDDVILVLPDPTFSRRGQILFNIDLSHYNVQ